MRVLIILNDAPYGGERTYNGLRLALAMLKADPAVQMTAFLLGDAVLAAKAGQEVLAIDEEIDANKRRRRTAK